MQTKTIKVLNSHGLHLRVAARIVQKNKNLKSRVVFCKDCAYADGCSVLQLLLLGATKDSELRVVVIGEDEQKAIEELSFLFSDGAGI